MSAVTVFSCAWTRRSHPEPQTMTVVRLDGGQILISHMPPAGLNADEADWLRQRLAELLDG